ncbi:MAG: alpha/beta hydrolase [Myxococcaceae bacterium]|jgi:pimeloyl-ACP methyl ester carboxylesterase|nr:alpha/beta hydrolase [Myxococcaceae bacterium]
MKGVWVEHLPLVGTAGRLTRSRALASRPGLSFVDTPGGPVRVRRAPCARGPRLLIACDGPNVIEHADALLSALDGQADVVLFEPPGTGASVPARGFDFTISAFADACAAVLEAVGPRVLVFPCYLGLVAQAVALRVPSRVEALVLPQAPNFPDLGRWADVVDPRRLVRTPVVGQLLLGARTRAIAHGWYRASTSDRRFREPFIAAADLAFDFGGCFCLASLMQGFEASPAPVVQAVPMRAAVVVGGKDRTHKHTNFGQTLPGAEVVRFDECGHSPELEAPERFVRWLLPWLAS